jgi:hypothetical protein
MGDASCRLTQSTGQMPRAPVFGSPQLRPSELATLNCCAAHQSAAQNEREAEEEFGVHGLQFFFNGLA